MMKSSITMLFATPQLGKELEVVQHVEDLNWPRPSNSMSHAAGRALSAVCPARAIQGSNSIEGFVADLD